MTGKNEFENIFEAFSATAAKFSNKTAVIYLGTRFSYHKILMLAENFASSLRDQGIGEGDKVIIYLPNCVQWVVAWLGIQLAGGVVVPIPPIYTAYDLQYIANDSGASHVVCADTNYGYVKQALPETGLEKVIITKLADLLPLYKRVFGWAFNKVPKGKVSNEENTLLSESW